MSNTLFSFPLQKTKVIFDPSEVRRSVSDLPSAKRLKKASASAAAGVASAGRSSTSRATAAATSDDAGAAARHGPGRPAAGSAASGKRTCHFCQRSGRQEVVLVCRQCKTPGEHG